MGTYKVAVATSDGVNVDSHFGHADHFRIFEVDEDTAQFTERDAREANPACGGGQCAAGSSAGAGQTKPEASVPDCGECGGTGDCSSCAPGSPPGPAPADPMDAIAANLSDVDYVLCARIGPHAIRALARYGVSAYDIVLPIGEAVEKINVFRKKIKARKKVSCPVE